jgi:uridine kinase
MIAIGDQLVVPRGVKFVNRVVAVAGPPGAGKTMVVKALAQRLESACSILCDDYQRITDVPLEEVLAWARRGGDVDEFVIPKLGEDLKSLKAGLSVHRPRMGVSIEPASVIFFETLFGKLHSETARFIDQLVWIEIPLDVALARKIRSFTASVSEGGSHVSADVMLAWLDNYLTAYTQATASLLNFQRERILEGADLVVDGLDDVEAIADEIEEFLFHD